MSQEMKNKTKQSFILGSLTGSVGVFIAKAIGLLYVVPFTALATENNMVFYSASFTYYNILLQISSAGLPYAISAIVAKYANRDDYKTVVLVRKLSTGILAASGFLMSIIFVLLSTSQSRTILGPNTTPEDVEIMIRCFKILAIALFLVPILYSYRGFYQGLKDMQVYATTQVLEQFARVAALLGLGFIFVRVMHFDAIYSVYMAILATSIGAGAAILYYIHYDHRHYGPISRAARNQQKPAVEVNLLLAEIIGFGIPYLLSSILGNTQILINTRYFIRVMTGFGMEYETAKLIYGIIELNCDKLTSIPQVLGIGFSAGIVPYMTIALENNNIDELKRNIRDCLDTVLYIGLPICFCMFALARPIYYVMYGNRNLNYGEICLTFSSILGLATTLTPICNSMMMTLKLRKEVIFYLCVGFAVKCITFYPMLKYTGYTGAITSSILTSLSIIYLDLSKLHNIYGVTYTNTLGKFLKMLFACFAMNVLFFGLKMIGFTITESSRLIALLQLGVYGILGIILYLYLTSLMKIPESIFRRSIIDVLRTLFTNEKKSRR